MTAEVYFIPESLVIITWLKAETNDEIAGHGSHAGMLFCKPQQWMTVHPLGPRLAFNCATRIADRLVNIQAVATWHTRDGDFITPDDALIEYNPILPGQRSAFKIYSTWNPEMATYRMDFKALLGDTIDWEDRRQ